MIIDMKNNHHTSFNNPNNPNTPNLWPRTPILRSIILSHTHLKKLTLRNLHLSPYQLIDLLSCILTNPLVYSLDISNSTSLYINRLGIGIDTLNNC